MPKADITARPIQNRVRNVTVKNPEASDLPSPITASLESAWISTSARGSSLVGSASSLITAPRSVMGRVWGWVSSIAVTIRPATTMVAVHIDQPAFSGHPATFIGIFYDARPQTDF